MNLRWVEGENIFSFPYTENHLENFWLKISQNSGHSEFGSILSL